MSNYTDMINKINLTRKEETETEAIVRRLMGNEYDNFTKEEQSFLLKQYHAHKGSLLNINGYLKTLKKRLGFKESRIILLKAYIETLSDKKENVKKGIKMIESQLDRLDKDILFNAYVALSKAYLALNDSRNSKRYANLVLEIDPSFPSAN